MDTGIDPRYYHLVNKDQYLVENSGIHLSCQLLKSHEKIDEVKVKSAEFLQALKSGAFNVNHNLVFCLLLREFKF